MRTASTTSESESIVEGLDYFPYGGLRIDTKTNYGGVRNKYAGTVYDALSGLNYMQARYQNSSRGQFVSEDPSFLALGDPSQVQQVTGQDQRAFLSDPQQMNSYGYGRDNPITKSDPSGNAIGIDDAAGFVVGAAMGTAIYAGQSALTGQSMTWGGATGAFLSGGIVGVGAVNVPETGGLSLAVASAAVYGGAGGLIGNWTKQLIDIRTGAQKSGFDTSELGSSGAAGFIFGGLTEGAVPTARVPLLSSGRNSWYAVGQTAQTRIANGYATTMSASTAFKGAVGSQAASIYRNLVSALLDASRTLSAMQTQQKATSQK